MAEAPAKDADSSQGKAKRAADSDDDHDDGKDKVVPQVCSRITENPYWVPAGEILQFIHTMAQTRLHEGTMEFVTWKTVCRRPCKI